MLSWGNFWFFVWGGGVGVENIMGLWWLKLGNFYFVGVETPDLFVVCKNYTVFTSNLVGYVAVF